MNTGFFRKEMNYTMGVNKYNIPIVFFFIIIGTLFCNIGIFENPEWISKWYWLFMVIPVCYLLSLFYGYDRCLFVNTILFSLFALFIYSFIRIVVGVYTISTLALFVLFLLIYLLSIKINNDKIFDGCTASIMCAAVFLALYGCIEYIGCVIDKTPIKIGMIFDNPAGYASALTISLPFIIYFTFSDRRCVRLLAFTTFISIVFIIILSASRAAFISVVVLIFIYIIKQYGFYLKKMFFLKIILCMGILLLILCGLYFVKKDSADGRIIIWKCTLDMIKDKPFLGHGYKSVENRYMLYQADCFKRNPESEYLQLADNVKHPFNEYLLLIAELGLVAFVLLIVLCVNFIRRYLKNRNKRSFTLMLALLMVGILSFFSYPFKYPFTWVIVLFCIGSFDAQTRPENEVSIKCGMLKYVFISLSVLLLSYTICMIRSEYKWHNIAHRTNVNTLNSLIYEYDKLYIYLNKNAYFIYNYAVKLNQAGHFKESIKMISECESLLNDYDIQMLKADNYKQIGDFFRAIDCYILASNMCPNRFIPLYELVNIYDSINQSDKANKLALEIIKKPVKIPSKIISMMKQRMEQRIDTCVVNDSGEK